PVKIIPAYPPSGTGEGTRRMLRLCCRTGSVRTAFVRVGMPDVPALDHEDDILADILRVVADALQRPRRPHDVHGPLDAARILHHEGDALPGDGVVFLVRQLVFLHHGPGGLHVETR